MRDRNVDLINIARIDLLKGRVNADLDSLSKILLDNYHNKFECEIESTFSEDSICPPNEILDNIKPNETNNPLGLIEQIESFLYELSCYPLGFPEEVKNSFRNKNWKPNCYM